MGRTIGLDLKSKRERRRSDYVFHQDYRTRWADNDMFHHLNNPIYGVLIDSIINSYLIDKCGYSTSKSDRIGLVANSYCDYFGSAQYPGVLDVGLRVVKLGKSSVVYEVGVFQQGEEKVKAVGGFTQIWVKREDNKVDSEGVPRHIREEMAKLVNSEDSDVVKPSKL
ncbi:hypothetical protein LTR05_004500 [Lithohypha guttulata]|uniref:Thioesterase domain-containing protein n=1 Tax=Lithohypha guttulata TaxID=1690604 RepID=A0AAN7SYU3_9EURO|nr:hypothetical protein LTR05_004500 [Lithohypha guttulata]